MVGETTTHTTLLTRLRDGSDPSAWREFNDRYGELIRAFARRRGVQSSDCDDIAQEVMFSLAKAMPGFRYDPEKGKFRSYLKTATIRTIFRKSRQKHGTLALGSIEDTVRSAATDADVEQAWELEWRRYHLRQAMRSLEMDLGEAERQAFRLYAVEGRDAGDTAMALGITVNQVYQAKSRILKRLEKVIELQVQDEG